MAESQLLILDKKQIQQKINRIAYQVLEDNLGEKEIVLAGIWDRGYKIALRLKKVLSKISDLKITMLKVDLDRVSTKLVANTDLDESHWKNKVIILVDDVLNSGKTLAYGLGVFLNTPHKKIRTVVLVDRSHKIFPIATDFVGLQMSTVLKEHVDVVIDVEGEEDRVYLS
ncbi:pyrimidine operon attenuation protein / uracil phosphoribosyltransferase [Pedobacter steynii]|jgi:pyrimidine operon attenuation protein/uracil phosphoribosyltransferase|uniref:Pyrimidine operon attenuation protein / uracil phosphoribosyltransferase n=1 Tax=Pedobacter steynii TaxID=430522 RepID=A0A1G9XF23_9SPHI|nr:phosphoribosyltransferase family protein [Pedobacter steynii]NQX40574.1 phosphoribosyltransferase [Pedobacter steynii]SDM95344.1 pyrimidine operon attenuation protein / uracil phosphoribosyltransferase [Pedobacter steynii]